MSASQILLTGRGPEDRWLTESPNRTYFEGKYPPRSNRFRETYEVPFDNQEATFGATGRCTIPVKGDYLTRLTLRAVFPPIYPTVEGEYVYPTPSSQVGASVYANMGLTLVVADGVTLTANTVGNHYMSIGAAVTLSGTTYSIFDLDGTYTVTSIPTANSFTCSTTLAGISYNGTMSFVGIACGDIISYFSTTNSNLWVNNLTNKTWQITSGSNVGTSWTFTTSAPTNFPVGSQVLLNLPLSEYVNNPIFLTSSSDTTFTSSLSNVFIATSINNILSSVDNAVSWNETPVSGIWTGVAYGNGRFVAIDYVGQIGISTDNGKTWSVSSQLSDLWTGIRFGNGTFVATGYSGQLAYSTDGQSWTVVYLPGDWNSIAYGDGVFVAVDVSYGQIARSTTNGSTWSVTLTSSEYWNSIAYGNGTFIAGQSVPSTYVARSTDGGVSWTTPYRSTYGISGIAYGNGLFCTISVNYGGIISISSDDGLTWQNTVVPGYWRSITYGNNKFVAGGVGVIATSTNGTTWKIFNSDVNNYDIGVGDFMYINSPSDSVSLVNSPLQLTNRVFSSDIYPSISFQNAADAAFWGFDFREGLAYSLPATPPWTYTQSGWVSGFLPPSLSTWDDSVAHKLVRDARILVGKQTIKEYTGEYIELQNDLTVPYENKAIMKLMNGTLDQTQSTASREYYTTLPLGTKEIPLCALTHQQMSVEIDFESFTNLSRNLNQGTGTFIDAKSFTAYDASTLASPFNVQTTFSYQQYIFIVTYDGQFVIYDTTKDFADPTSYIVLSAFSGTSLFIQFCVLSGTLYIGLSNGTLASIIIEELIQANISSFATNNYAPTIGTLTGTLVADFRYLYYTVSNTATSNVFMTRYDTTGSFTNPMSYTTVDFSAAFSSNVTGVYQTLSDGTQLIMIPQGVPGTIYTYQLNANVQSQWYSANYSSYGYQITEGVLVGNSFYFILDGFNILKYSSSTFNLSFFQQVFATCGSGAAGRSVNSGETWNMSLINQIFSGGVAYGNGKFIGVYQVGSSFVSLDYGLTWKPLMGTPANVTGYSITFGNNTFVVGRTNAFRYSNNNGNSWTNVTYAGNWFGITFGYDKFVAVTTNSIAHSTNNGRTWTSVTLAGDWTGVTFGNGFFVAVSYNSSKIARSTDGISWSTVSLSDYWNGVAYGNGTFVAASNADKLAYSNDNGQTWNVVSVSGSWKGVQYGNNTFVAVGYIGYVGSLAYSKDKGVTWTTTTDLEGYQVQCIGVSPLIFSIPGSGFKNLIAMGDYIYCSTSNVAVRIDTTKDLSTAGAYEYPAPLPTAQYITAHGPRYVYLFTQDPTETTSVATITRFDPYPPVPVLKTSILVDYESLPEGTKKPDKALIGLVQTQKVTDLTNMDIHGPVKELWVTGPSAASNVFQYSNLSDQSALTLAGEHIVTDDVGTRTFLNTIQPFETHKSMPIRNVSVIPFEFDPESEIPNGTVNFSRIRDQVFDGDAETVWARNYNILSIQGGTGGLIFNS